MAQSAPCIALIAGETSGDALGAALISALRRQLPDARFVGVGGPQMRAAGQEQWADCEALAVMGLVEVIKHLPRLLALRRSLRQRLQNLRPDIFVGIDAPDFNLGLARRLRAAGIATVHYVSPSIWAWRQGRAARIGRCVDQVLCLLPFEPALYAEHAVDARFVGHPMADQLPLRDNREQARAALSLAPEARVLALLPGSRGGEIQRLGEDFLRTAEALQQSSAVCVVAPMANARCRRLFETIRARCAPNLRISLIDGRSDQVMTAADAVLVASGTAALEAMLCHRPMIVAYRIAPLSYRLVRWFKLIRTPWVSLPNALAGRMVVPECLQDACRAEIMQPLLAGLLEPDSAEASAQVSCFLQLHHQLRCNASEQAADAIVERLKGMPRGAQA